MRWCQRCVYPEVTVNLGLDDDGICSACRAAEKMEALKPKFWDQRRKKFEQILEESLRGNKSNYDCVIPVSGGKDSYFQAHIMASKYGLKPLLVTYHGNNYLPEGDYDRDRMRQVFDADHMVFGPSVDVLKKLNRLTFRRMGDMNWHAHCGIFTVPIQAAVHFKIPLIIWGEIVWDTAGMFEPDDFVEFSARVRHEHALRGYEWYDLINDPREPLSEKDMKWAQYPSDEDILKVGVRGLYIGNFFKWDPNQHTPLVKKKYGWIESIKPFQRTYRRMSNLDDRYENGTHDLLKYIKFGYGRASDHASKDIRSGYMDRKTAIKMVKKYDHVIPDDLSYWLKYVGMSEREFWKVANSFRDPRVWRKNKSGEWEKDNIWEEKKAK